MQPALFGNYTLLRRIAAGGTAEIYLARLHGVEGFARHLAIKRILPHLAEEQEFVQLILDEARLAAHLHHGHIVQIHEVGLNDGQAYIAMEYLPGVDLGRLCKAARKRRRRVLILHPDAEKRAALAEAVGALDVKVVTGANAEEAALRSQEGPLDLAIVDHSLVGPIRDALLHGLQSSHPELLRVVLLGKPEGRGYGVYVLSTEATEPEQVRRLARQCLAPKIPLELALLIIRAVADGLDYAHKAQDFEAHPLEIVHRDVNPSNVLVSTSGTVKLVDFGIARAANTARKQKKGNFVGTFQYMSPEQARGKDVDSRSDLFSLGVLLYELVTGQHPFDGDNEFATMRAIREDDPEPLNRVVPGVPRPLVRIARRALRKAAEDRYNRAEDLLADLEDFTRREGLNLSPKRLSGFMKVVYTKEEITQFGVTGTGYTTPVPAVGPVTLDDSFAGDIVDSIDDGPLDSMDEDPTEAFEMDIDISDIAASGVRPKPAEAAVAAPSHPVDRTPAPPPPARLRGDGLMKVLLTLLIVALVAVAGWYWHWRTTQDTDPSGAAGSALPGLDSERGG